MDLGPLTPFAPGITAELASARLAAALGPCQHPAAEPVELLDGGEIVAALCPDCGTQLPAEWLGERSPVPRWAPPPPLPPYEADPALTARIME